jgi:hypothetical protein
MCLTEMLPRLGEERNASFPDALVEATVTNNRATPTNEPQPDDAIACGKASTTQTSTSEVKRHPRQQQNEVGSDMGIAGKPSLGASKLLTLRLQFLSGLAGDPQRTHPP